MDVAYKHYKWYTESIIDAALTKLRNSCLAELRNVAAMYQEETGKRYRADLAGEILMGTIDEATC